MDVAAPVVASSSYRKDSRLFFSVYISELVNITTSEAVLPPTSQFSRSGLGLVHYNFQLRSVKI